MPGVLSFFLFWYRLFFLTILDYGTLCVLSRQSTWT